ncbi:MAG: WYL domain-containing protein [Chloroflexi bacterium]|nr:MAG: hypothetical protein CUN54_07350 [Phototrophicales bacterium]RMF76096.1 MAG: WYL domain-containing protein [Chloroflexota bacterium]
MRSSQWDVIYRCLHVLAHLQRGPATKKELLKSGKYSGQDIDKQFEGDLRRLREHFQVEIRFNRHDKMYQLYDLGTLPFFDLPPKALEGMNFLVKTFTPASPHYRQVRDLFDILKLRLSQEQLAKLERDSLSVLDLRQVDSDTIPDSVFEKLERAYREQRKVEFEYRSPQRDDESIVRHVVQPATPRFDAMRGHYYMRAFCEETYSKQYGPRLQDKYIYYRVGRIVPESIQILPNRIPTLSRRTNQYEVVYWLAPRIARYGVSERFDDMRVEQHDDGSATIHAMTDDLFTAARSLLYYGPNCRVLGGDALLAEFKDLVFSMAEQYSDES